MPANITAENVVPEETTVEAVAITREDVAMCRFSSWYGQFRDVTFKSRIVHLPKEFIDYLNADGIYLPEEG